MRIHTSRRIRCLFAMVAGAGAVMVAIIGVAPAFACTVVSHIETDARHADPGEVVRIEGSGFELDGNPVNVYWGGESGALLATAPVKGGTFALNFTVPSNAVPGGKYLIEAVQDSNPLHSGNTVFRVSRPAPPAAETRPVAAAPAPAAVPDPAPAAAPVPRPVAAPQPAADPLTAPVDASGFSTSGAGAFTSSGQAVAPLLDQDRADFSGRVHPGSSRSPWLLIPLGVAGLTLFSAAAASVAREAAREGARATL